MAKQVRVGQIRPSQLMFTYGVGAIVDLPKLSVIVSGLEDWPNSPQYAQPITENRILSAVRHQLPTVKKLLSAPIVPDTGLPADPFDEISQIGIPVATFPRWMVCPRCRLLAPLSSGLFELKEDPYHPDRTVYRHINCNKAHKHPEVIPARFLVACASGHLDDFPWIEFLHQGQMCDSPQLQLIEYGPSGEARDLEVRCSHCGMKRRLSEAFGNSAQMSLPSCKGRRPHLRDYDPAGCDNPVRTIILGASNLWFPVVLRAIAIPTSEDKLTQLIEDRWGKLQSVTSLDVVHAFRIIGQIEGELAQYSDEAILDAVMSRHSAETNDSSDEQDPPDLKAPEWEVLTHPELAFETDDFRINTMQFHQDFQYANWIKSVVLVERLREVCAMIGFTRIDSLGELADTDVETHINPAPLVREEPQWVPANDVRGEGIFIQFGEQAIRAWLKRDSVQRREEQFHDAYKKWCLTRRMQPSQEGFPGMRFVLMHTFSHSLLLQLALQCGYSAASIRERIYARSESDVNGPMAGVLIYTSAPDSEGTLGGLINLP